MVYVMTGGVPTAQEVVGGDAPFEAFMRQYFTDFAYSNVSSDRFKEYFMDHFSSVPAVKDIDWDTWYYAPGNANVCVCVCARVRVCACVCVWCMHVCV